MNRRTTGFSSFLCFALVSFNFAVSPLPVKAWDYSYDSNPYADSGPRYNDPSNDSGDLSHSPSHDLYGRETWDSLPRTAEPPAYMPPPSFSPTYKDQPDYNAPKGVWGSDGRYTTCQHSFNTTVCQ